MSEKAPFMVFSGTNSRYLAEKICASLDCPLGKMNITHFADGEFAVSYEESIRGSHVFLVQSTFPNSDNLMELLLMVDAAKRASAKSVVAVIPYFGWARQDRKDKPRVSIGAKLVADLLSVAGIDRLITMDLHADQIQGFFNIPVDHLYASAVFLPYIESLKLEDLVIATPDVGGSKRASTFSKYLGVPLVLCNKTREKFPLLFPYIFFLLIFYPPFSHKICFTFSVSRSSQKIRFMLFRLIPLPAKFRLLRYKYNSLTLKPMLIRLNMVSTASRQ